MQKLIIDADPGVGSALALLAAMRDPEIDLLAITATAGRVSAAQASNNIQALVDLFDPPKRPRIGWAAENVSSLPQFPGEPCSAMLNGQLGLGDFEFNAPQPHHRIDSPKLLAELVREYPNEITLLTLGPLTNVARANDYHPGLLQKLHEIVIVGGNHHHSGDITPAAEFNFYADPQSGRTVLSAPATKTLVPLDVSEKIEMTYEQYSDWIETSQTPVGQVLREMLKCSFRSHHQLLGRECVPLRELVGLAVAVRPLTAESRQIAVDVESQGKLTRGMTIFDDRPHPTWKPNVELVTALDSQGVLDYCRTMLQACGKTG
ncbi:MAG: nucleoside hydrolase [Planctomycetaceae bacterium]|nr:nucleoside hydrolase [Planctomycetaceae bacterium]